MKKISPFFTALIMLLFTTTWSIKADRDSMLPSDLAGKWFITEVDGKKIATHIMPFIQFDTENNTIHSKTACNRLDTRYVASGSKLDINMKCFYSTALFCSQDIMELENQIREAMGKITNFVGNKKVLKNVDLKDDNGKTLLKLER